MDLKRHEIPTHLDVEDTLFLGLTVRQVMLILIGVGIGYSGWQSLAHTHLPIALRIVLCLIVPLLALVLAIVKPAERPLELWTIAVLRYHAQPRVYVWRPVARNAVADASEDADELERVGHPDTRVTRAR